MKNKEGKEKEAMIAYLPGSMSLAYRSLSGSKREALTKAANLLPVIFNDKGIRPAILDRGQVVVQSKSPERFRQLARKAKTVADYRRANDLLELSEDELIGIMRKRAAAKAAKKAAEDTIVWCQICGTPQEVAENCPECGSHLMPRR